MPELPEIIEEARKAAKEERWDKIDNDLVPRISEQFESKELKNQVTELLVDHNGNVRDLGCTLADQLKEKEVRDISHHLIEMVSGVEPNLYTKFRVAMVLKKHGLHKEYGPHGSLEKTLKDVFQEVKKTEKEEGAEKEEIYKLADQHLRELENQEK